MAHPEYPPPATRPGSVPMGLAMKRRNPITVWLVWPLLALGIYHLVWYYKIHREMAEFDRRREVPVGPMLGAPAAELDAHRAADLVLQHR
ncbi:DUF4234 domain-containing protein [Haloechinothrix halophila]|uniref:DUF4234 domain-containing protein n=1 Tax=Haloechinothrix halophila TaxID=1069073 RepID=UPI001E3C594F|nr:DUF4234 domain-containing protein [Haloechinothrix halophila]